MRAVLEETLGNFSETGRIERTYGLFPAHGYPLELNGAELMTCLFLTYIMVLGNNGLIFTQLSLSLCLCVCVCVCVRACVRACVVCVLCFVFCFSFIAFA